MSAALGLGNFFTVEALGLTGTVRYMVFFVIVVKTRVVEIAGIATNPDGEWMKQMARNLTDSVDAFLRNATYLIHDRDPLYTAAFEALLKERGVKCVKIPAQSPNCRLGGQLIEKDFASASNNRATGRVTRRSRLGGMLNFYVREAA